MLIKKECSMVGKTTIETKVARTWPKLVTKWEGLSFAISTNGRWIPPIMVRWFRKIMWTFQIKSPTFSMCYYLLP